MARFTVDTPVPYRISDLTGLIDERMGKLENKRDLSPYRQLRTHINSISQDGRYAFMFGSLTIYDGMTQVLSRIFRVPVNNKPITIVELTGLPTEIVNVVVSVLARMTFDFAHWSEGKVPLTLVCEEAHRYVPAADHLGFEPCKRAIAKIAKEGRKYGVALCIVSQRPAEVDPTILSQCNTVFALRMSNDRDQEIVTSAITDTGSGLLEFLPSLGQREALAFGDGVALPVRIKFDELPANCLPRSTTARFTEHWQKLGRRRRLPRAGGREVAHVRHWRRRRTRPAPGVPRRRLRPRSTAIRCTRTARQPDPRREGRDNLRDAQRFSPADPSRSRPAPMASVPRRRPHGRPPAAQGRPPGVPQPQEAAADEKDVPGTALKSLRDRLIQRQQR